MLNPNSGVKVCIWAPFRIHASNWGLLLTGPTFFYKTASLSNAFQKTSANGKTKYGQDKWNILYQITPNGLNKKSHAQTFHGESKVRGLRR